jgi:hypothetical protein
LLNVALARLVDLKAALLAAPLGGGAPHIASAWEEIATEMQLAGRVCGWGRGALL